MKKIFIYFFLISNLLAIKSWTQKWTCLRTPFPNESINDIFFDSLNKGFVACDGGIIGVSCNGGSTWNYLQPVANVNLYSICNVNANLYYVSGDNGVVVKSTDGGFTWNNLNFSNTTNIVNKVYFLNPDTGFVVTPYEIFKTINGGISWANVFSNYFYYGSYYVTDIHFFNDLHGYVSMGNKKYSTVDGGNSWIAQTYTNNMSVSKFITPKIGFGFFNNSSTNYYYKTVDSGQSWNLVYSYACNDPFFTRMQVLDTNNVVVIDDNPGNSGIVFHKTINGGSNWSSLVDFNFNYSKSIYFINPTKGYFGTHWGQIASTVNSGVNWNNYNNDFHTGHSLYALDSQNIYLGHLNYLNKTNNGGITWPSILPPAMSSSYDFIQLKYIDTLHGRVLGSNGTIYFTNNGNTSWSATIPNSGAKQMRYYDSSFCMAILYNGQIGITHDNGTNWSYITLDSTAVVPRQINFIDSLHWYVGANYGIFKTNDAGNSWIKVPNNWFELKSLDFVDTNIVYTSVYPKLMKSINGGVTWDTVYSLINSPSYAQIINTKTGIVNHSSSGENYHNFSFTNDSTSTWTKFTLPSFKNLNAIQLLDSNHIYFYTGFGNVWLYSPYTINTNFLPPMLNSGNKLTCLGDSLHIQIANYSAYNLSTDSLFAVLKNGNTILQILPIDNNGIIHFTSPNTIGNYTLEVTAVSSNNQSLATSIIISTVQINNPLNGYWYQAGNPNCSADPITVSLNLITTQLSLGYNLNFHKIQNGIDSIISNTTYNVLSNITDTCMLYYSITLGINTCNNPITFYSDTLEVNAINPVNPTASISTALLNNSTCPNDTFSLTVTAQNVGQFNVVYTFHKINSLLQDSILQSGNSNIILVNGLNDSSKFYCIIDPGWSGCFINGIFSSDTIQINLKPTINSNYQLIQNPSNPLCSNDTLVLNCIGQNVVGNNYLFYLNSTLIQFSNIDSIMQTAYVNGNQYYVNIQNPNYCILNSSTNTISLNVIPLLTPILTFDGISFSTTSVLGATYNWYLNGVLVDSSSINTYVPNANGVYSVQVFSNGCNSVFSNTINFNSLSINDANLESNSSFFNFGTLYTVTSKYNIKKIVVTDINGKIILQKNNNDYTKSVIFSAENCSRGIYFFNILTENGIEHIKLLIE